MNAFRPLRAASATMRPLFLAGALLLSPAILAAQAAVDAGVFTITRAGAVVGTERFSIRRLTGTDAGSISVATIDLDGERLSPALRTDDGAAVAYQLEIRRAGSVVERLKGLISRGRFTAQITSPHGESAKESIVSPGAIILDHDIFHQYYFLAQRAGAGTVVVPTIIPRRNTQEMMRVRSLGSARLAVGGVPLEARTLLVTAPDGSTRHVWVDRRGRVLRVSLDAQHLVAQRVAPPR